MNLRHNNPGIYHGFLQQVRYPASWREALTFATRCRGRDPCMPARKADDSRALRLPVLLSDFFRHLPRQLQVPLRVDLGHIGPRMSEDHLGGLQAEFPPDLRADGVA